MLRALQARLDGAHTWHCSAVEKPCTKTGTLAGFGFTKPGRANAPAFSCSRFAGSTIERHHHTSGQVSPIENMTVHKLCVVRRAG